MLITRMTPKIRVRPDASSAYTPPTRMPRMRVWTNCVMTGRGRRSGAWAPPPSISLLGRGLVALDDVVACGGVLRQHDLRLAALPLADEELPLRAAVRVPAQRAEDRVDRVRAQPVGELELVLLGERLVGLHRRLQHARRRERVGRVLGHLLTAEHLLVLGDELGVARRLGLLAVAGRVEHAFGVLRTDALGILLAERRRVGLVEPLRREADLVERAQEAHAVLELRAGDHEVGVLRLDR